MKQKLIIILLVLCACIALWPRYSYGQLKTAKLIATFDGKDKHYIDTVYCRVKYETTFILPPHRKIQKAITGDPDEWEIEGKYGGRIISVKPLAAAGHTSLTIITQSMHVYKFNIVNIMTVENPGYDVIAIVEIREQNTTMEVIGGEESKPATDRQIEPTTSINSDSDNWNDRHIEKMAAVSSRPEKQEKRKKHEHFGNPQKQEKENESTMDMNYDYNWKGDDFAIDSIYDDGVFTYIVMTRATVFPAVHLVKNQEKRKDKHLEPVRYTIKPGMIVVFQLMTGKEAYVLRLGTGKDMKEAVIYRKNERGKR